MGVQHLVAKKTTTKTRKWEIEPEEQIKTTTLLKYEQFLFLDDTQQCADFPHIYTFDKADRQLCHRKTVKICELTDLNVTVQEQLTQLAWLQQDKVSSWLQLTALYHLVIITIIIK